MIVSKRNLENAFLVLERAASQMRYQDLNMDLAFWNDNETSNLLPLWSFSISRAFNDTINCQTKCISWLGSSITKSQPSFIAAVTINENHNGFISAKEGYYNTPKTIISSFSLRNPRYSVKSFEINGCCIESLDVHVNVIKTIVLFVLKIEVV